MQSAMPLGDWVDAGILLVAICTLLFTAYSVRKQTQALVFQSYLDLTDRLSNAWRSYRDANEKNKDYEFIELLNLFESTCHLFNEKNFHGATREMICDYLKEVLPKIFEEEQIREKIQANFSGPDTFFQIRRFAKKHCLENVPYQ